MDHHRGATGIFDVVDMILLHLVGIIAGARSKRATVTVWHDHVLCRAAGWLRFPDETTLSEEKDTLNVQLQDLGIN